MKSWEREMWFIFTRVKQSSSCKVWSPLCSIPVTAITSNPLLLLPRSYLHMLSSLFLITVSYRIYKAMEIVFFLFLFLLIICYDKVRTVRWVTDGSSSSVCSRKLPLGDVPCRNSSLPALLWKTYCTIPFFPATSHLPCVKRKRYISAIAR